MVKDAEKVYKTCVLMCRKLFSFVTKCSTKLSFLLSNLEIEYHVLMMLVRWTYSVSFTWTFVVGLSLSYSPRGVLSYLGMRTQFYFLYNTNSAWVYIVVRPLFTIHVVLFCDIVYVHVIRIEASSEFCSHWEIQPYFIPTVWGWVYIYNTHCIIIFYLLL